MTEEWDELKRLFHDTCARPRSEWPALLSVVVARDRTLGDKLAALLQAHEAGDSFLESSPLALLESVEPSLPRLVSGARLGPYEIVKFIGAGGMGEVYRARDERLGRDVAIKILPDDLAEDTNRHRRMELEARAVGMLNHPNILTVYDVGLYDGSPFIVSELLEGETLRTSLERSRAEGRMGLPVEEAWRVVRAMAEGLAAAHGRGVVHRDLKPDNVFVTSDGRVKILDFGLAKLTAPGDSEGHRETMAGTVLGTVGYMAPEQVRGQAAGPRGGHLCFRRDFLRAAERPPPLRRRQRRGHDGGDPHGGSCSAAVAVSRRAGRGGVDHRAMPGKESGRPLPVRHGAGRRSICGVHVDRRAARPGNVAAAQDLGGGLGRRRCDRCDPGPRRLVDGRTGRP